MILQYVSEKSDNKNVRISRPGDCLQLLDDYKNINQECLLVILLSGAHDVIKLCLVSVGLVNRTVVHPREVFVHAVRDMAAAIIILHNHPSGNIEPSTEDNEVTSRIRAAGDVIGIPCLDHIIFNKDLEYYSYLEEGKL